MKQLKFSALEITGWVTVVLLIIALLIVVSCTYKDMPARNPGLPSYVHRYVDEEAGVVCWVYEYGIDCLPIEQTRLGK